MAIKCKGGPRGKRGKKKVDPVRVQVAVGGKKPIGVRMTRELMDDIIRQWINTGRVPKGLKITQVRWINPKRANESLARWKEATTTGQIDKARRTLRLRQLLQGGMRFRSVGSIERVRGA